MIACFYAAIFFRNDCLSQEKAHKKPDLPLPQQTADNVILVKDISDPNKLSNLAEVLLDAVSGNLANASSNLKCGENF